jgi:hypothetical protein
MNQPLILFGVAATIALLTGCASHRKVGSLTPTQPVVQIIPAQGNVEPKVAPVPSRPDPIYFNPIIEEVEMAPYVNDEGNLVFPGKVLVIREPGHWNLEAAQKSRQYFVPADNQPPQLAPPSKSYYDFIQSKKNGAVTTRLDVSRVRVTGYSQKEERPEALATLLPGETLAFDPYLGWLAIPDEKEEEAQQSPRQRSAASAPVESPAQPKSTSGPAPTPKDDDIKHREKQLEQILDNAFKKLEKPSR